MNEPQELVQIEPLELRFPFELHKEIKCSLRIVNKTNEYIAFKVGTTQPKKYCVRPNHGLMDPGSDFSIVVVTRLQKEASADMNCIDKFLVQSVIVTESTIINTLDDVTNIIKEPGNIVHRVKLSVAYEQKELVQIEDPELRFPSVVLNSSAPEESEQGSLPTTSICSSSELNERQYNTLMPEIHFQRPETLEEVEEEQEGEEEEQEKDETTPASTQNVDKFEAMYLAEVQKRKKLEEENKKLVKQLQEKLCCIEFKFEDLKKATDDFAETLKIGEGTYGAVYKGVFHHTNVAIKKLKFKDERGFNEEIETLSKVRHPNLVTLIGACRESNNLALVYEYLPLGSLEDHLNCKNNTPPLSGQTRIRIAMEICSALCLLHSTLRSHGDLKPDNILLDSNYVSKLSDFGTCRQLKPTKGTITPSYQTENVTGTYAYMDPEYLSSGVMTPRFDVYSFGVVLLRLATGKGACEEVGRTKTSIKELVDIAIEDDTFDQLVDTSIEWPSKEAPEKMAQLGLQCFKYKRHRPSSSKLFVSLKDIASNK